MIHTLFESTMSIDDAENALQYSTKMHRSLMAISEGFHRQLQAASVDSHQLGCFFNVHSDIFDNAIMHGNLGISSNTLREHEEAGTYSKYLENITDRDLLERAITLHIEVERLLSTVRQQKMKMAMTVVDEGNGFNPHVLDAGPLDQIHGNGLIMIRAFSDSVTHNEKGNSITVQKNFDVIERKQRHDAA